MISRGIATGVVALTFDAGGQAPGETATVLDTLRAYGFKGTFFLTGEWAAANPPLVESMVADGHELGNHTYDHPNLTDIPPAEIRSQITRTETAIQQAGGTTLRKYLRPPFGAYDRTVLIVLRQLDYELVFWSLDSGDWQGLTPAEMVERFDARAQSGDVVVFHPYAENTGQAIRGICEVLRSKGLTAGTLSHALGR